MVGRRTFFFLSLASYSLTLIWDSWGWRHFSHACLLSLVLVTRVRLIIMMGSGKNSSTALTRKDLCIFIESTKFLLWEVAKNISYSSFCSKCLGIIIRYCKILWGFFSMGKSTVLWSSNMLPGCGQGMDSMIHVISSTPFFLPGSVSALFFFFQGKKSARCHPLYQLETAFSLCLALWIAAVHEII